MAGVAGSGGKGGQNGKQFTVAHIGYFNNGVGNEIRRQRSNGCQHDGAIGTKPNDNHGDGIDPNSETIKPYRALNGFKSFARSKLKDNHRELDLRDFLMAIDNTTQINSNLSLIDFVNEFESMEQQFVILKKDISPKPFYLSFVRRLEMFNSTIMITAKDDEHKVFRMLYTAVLSKINAQNQKAATVVDLQKYLGVILENIAESNLLRQSLSIREESHKYNNLLDEKINKGSEIIKSQIAPEMSLIFDNIDTGMMNLVDQIIDEHNQTEQDLAKAKQLERKIAANIIQQKSFMFLNLAVGVLLTISGIGATAGALITAGLTAVEQLAKNEVTEIDKTYTMVKSAYNDRYLLLKTKLIDTEKALKEFENEHSLDPVREKSSDIKKKIDAAIREGKVLRFSQLREWQEGCSTVLNEHAELEKKKPNPKKKIINVLNKFAKLIDLGEIAMSRYRDIEQDETKLAEAHKQVVELQNKLILLERKEEFLIETMMPMLEETKSMLKNLIAELSKNKTQVEIDIGKWKVKGMLTKLQYALQDTFDADSQQLTRLFDRAKECMLLLLDIFDRCETARDQQKFANYISSLVSKPTYDEITNNTELRYALVGMKNTIVNNIILERHDCAIKALKQHKFPFAAYFLSKFDLNANQQLQQLQDDAKRNVRRMIEILNLNDAEATEETNDIVVGQPSDPSTVFFRWNHTSFNTSEVVSNLFRGKEIFLNANIRKQSDKNAVKFKEIELMFKIANNQSRENELRLILENFFINMTMGENGYYRCNNDIYYCPNDGIVVIYYKMKRASNGKPEKLNETYKKIIEAPRFFLTPYTTWQIRLQIEPTLRYAEKIQAWENLRLFSNEVIDIELRGLEEYVRRNSTTSEKYCQDDLNQFYLRANYS